MIFTNFCKTLSLSWKFSSAKKSIFVVQVRHFHSQVFSKCPSKGRPWQNFVSAPSSSWPEWHKFKTSAVAYISKEKGSCSSWKCICRGTCMYRSFPYKSVVIRNGFRENVLLHWVRFAESSRWNYSKILRAPLEWTRTKAILQTYMNN